MTIRNGQITAGSTAMSLSITGGAAITLSPITGDTNNVTLGVLADVNAATRRRVKVSTVQPKPAASMPSGYTMEKGTLEVIVPKTLANGQVENPKITIQKAFSVEMTAAEKAELRRLAAQLILDADFDDYWSINSNQ